MGSKTLDCGEIAIDKNTFHNNKTISLQLLLMK